MANSKRTVFTAAITGTAAAAAVAGALIATAGSAAGDTTPPSTSDHTVRASGLRYPGTTDNVWFRGYDRHLAMASFSDARHVSGGPDNGHWVAADRTARLSFAPNARFFAAVELCPTGGGVTLDAHGLGSTACTRSAAIASIAAHRVGIARITVDAQDRITSVREIYQP